MATAEQIKAAAKIINNDGVVVFPTETVYGIGAGVYSEAGVAKIFEIKQRPSFNPLIIHIANIKQVEELAAVFPEKAKKLADHFWPGPLTIILPKNETVPEIVTGNLATVGIRMPNHGLALALIEQAETPIAAPSANYFGQVSPTCAAHIDQLAKSVDMVLEGGPCDIGLESTIISFAGPEPRILRFGGVTVEQIEQVIGSVGIEEHTDIVPQSPGRLLKHYSPKTPLFLWDGVTTPDRDQKIGLLSFDDSFSSDDFAAVEILSKKGDLSEAATNLYAAMRRLDTIKLDSILAVKVSDTGIGRAINDRIERAAIK